MEAARRNGVRAAVLLAQAGLLPKSQVTALQARGMGVLAEATLNLAVALAPYDSIAALGAKALLGAVESGAADVISRALSEQISTMTGGEKVTVYRVEGLPNTRLVVGDTGQVMVLGDQTLFLNFGDKARALEFLAKRVKQNMPGAALKSFEVPQSFLTDLRNAAVSEEEVGAHPESPISLDVTKAKDQFGLRPDQIEALRETIIQKSGKVH